MPSLHFPITWSNGLLLSQSAHSSYVPENSWELYCVYRTAFASLCKFESVSSEFGKECDLFMQ